MTKYVITDAVCCGYAVGIRSDVNWSRPGTSGILKMLVGLKIDVSCYNNAQRTNHYTSVHFHNLYVRSYVFLSEADWIRETVITLSHAPGVKRASSCMRNDGSKTGTLPARRSLFYLFSSRSRVTYRGVTFTERMCCRPACGSSADRQVLHVAEARRSSAKASSGKGG